MPCILGAVGVLTDLDQHHPSYLAGSRELERLELGVPVRPGREVVPLDPGALLHLRDTPWSSGASAGAHASQSLRTTRERYYWQRRLRQEDIRRFLVQHRLHAGIRRRLGL